jgi:hypothetical protein
VRITVDTPLSPTRAVLIGLVLAAPGAWFLTANLMHDAGVAFLYAPFDALVSRTGLGPAVNVVSPVIFLGGPAVALVINLLAVGRFDLKWENHQIVTSAAMAPRGANVAMILGGGLLLAAFLAYAFVENFAVVLTHV